MPNYVANILSFDGDKESIKKMLSEIQNDEFGPGNISFNKIIPMPPDLNIESGSRTQEGLRIYMDFMDVYSLGHPLSKEEQLNVDERPEAVFLRIRPDINNEVWALGKKAYQNIVRYGAQDWYAWRNKHWGTKWDAGGYEENTDYSQCDKLVFRTAWGNPHRLSSNCPRSTRTFKSPTSGQRNRWYSPAVRQSTSPGSRSKRNWCRGMTR